MPTANGGGRYVLPSFEERTSYGTRSIDPYTKLFEERIVVLGTQVDETSGQDIMAQLLSLDNQDSTAPIKLYINSPGGSITAAFLIYDTMQLTKAPVHTYCMGQAASAAAMILSAGAPGHRHILPHARVMIHEPRSGGSQGSLQETDIDIMVREMTRFRELQEDIFVKHTGQPLADIVKNTQRDRFFTAEEAKAFGIVDEIIGERVPVAERPAKS